MLGVFVGPVLGDHYVKCVLDYIHFEDPIGLSGRGQTWRSIDLNQPRLEILFDQDIIAVQLEAVLVVNDCSLYTFEGNVDDVLDVVETLVSCAFAVGLF